MYSLNIFIYAFVLCSFSVVNGQEVIPLYDGKAPGSETWTWTEQTSTNNRFQTEVVYNVTDPTLTAYLPPKAAANGAAVIVAPGGAFHTLSINSEGREVARWLNSRGIAAFVLKYRVARSYTDDPVAELTQKMNDFKSLDEENEPIIPMAMADGLAAVQYVREHAGEINIDPAKIGFMGFSAGGTLAMSVVYNATDENRPNFVAPIYAYEPAIIGSEVPKTKTPIFIAVAGDDQLGMMPMSISIYRKWHDAGQPAELHIYEKGGHGFGMRTQNLPADTWYERFGEWMKMQGIWQPVVSTNPFQRIPTPNDTLHSVIRTAEGKIRFSIYAPQAQEVTVSGDFPGGNRTPPLQKDFNGVWSVTTEQAASPDIYTYDFYVDGIKTFDPKNPAYKESAHGFSNLIEFEGPENEFQSLKDVPHGRIEILHYRSESLGGINRRLRVYLPPGYDDLPEKTKLPVLYLLHGGGDNEASWTTAGRAHLILDNLYAEGKLQPMIVVMPTGHTPVKALAMGVGIEQDPFCQDFLEDIVPFIESTFPVSTRREHRAIAGLSMGGLQTMNLAFWRPELFSYVFPLSTGYFPNHLEEFEEHHAAVLQNQEINTFKLFKIYMGGASDIAYQNNLNSMALFDKYNLQYTYENGEGGHTFLAWRRNLYDFAPLLFTSQNDKTHKK